MSNLKYACMGVWVYVRAPHNRVPVFLILYVAHV